jgi:hypothetical protein
VIRLALEAIGTEFDGVASHVSHKRQMNVWRVKDAARRPVVLVVVPVQPGQKSAVREPQNSSEPNNTTGDLGLEDGCGPSMAGREEKKCRGAGPDWNPERERPGRLVRFLGDVPKPCT